MSVGSSPRLRGTLDEFECAEQICGIIPALAGNTSVESSKRFPTGDHPRACGEHWLRVRDVLPSQGSSPRLRGTPHQTSHETDRGGIIPALAGNTRS